MDNELKHSRGEKQTNQGNQNQQKTPAIGIKKSSKKTTSITSSSPYSGNTPDWLTLHYAEELLRHSSDTVPK